jgi:uncharacterized repeat protein (TIGR04138 family)
MQEVSLEEAIANILAKDTRYTRDSYYFIRDALDHTRKNIDRDRGKSVRHVSGQQLLEGIRDFALSQYGPMTMLVLEEWGIHACRDFGQLVFNMVDVGILAKTDKDSPNDFEHGYDFYEAFRKPYLPPSKQKESSSLPATPHN